ncbi:hypothetical protein K2173_005503 [Erythroxylum novogranatense]|uniref:Reverse transcriptase zinc-binding domain-containing protein n=1 Tax=Erythroxylum novogranatense TaxID=1862640 RepID=A0AAV8SKS6_9ROSI|nr:hypothetical protein K2173_005503 [Erythroxylum novogranatense]
MRFRVVASFVIVSGEWDWQAFEYLLLSNAIQLIAAILPPNENMDNDRPFWCPWSSGCFTLKTAYLSLCGQSDVVPRAPWHRIWKWVGSQRIKVFMWLCLSNGVLTNVERKRRNRVVLGDDSQPATLTVEAICCVGTQQAVQIAAAVRVEKGLPGTRREERLMHWSTPPAGVFKLNIDASLAADGIAAYGRGVVRDSHGNWVDDFVVNIGQCPMSDSECGSVVSSIDLTMLRV